MRTLLVVALLIYAPSKVARALNPLDFAVLDSGSPRRRTGSSLLPALCAALALAGPSGASSHAAVVHHIIAAAGDATPAGGIFNRAFYDPYVNSSGQVAFRGGIDGGPTEEGIFLYSGRDGDVLALPGDSAPAGGNYSYFGTDPIAGITDSGQVVYIAQLTGGLSNRGIFRHDGATATAVAVNYAPTPAGGVYDEVGYAAVHESGRVVFRSQLLGSSSLSGIFRNDSTTTTTIALDGAAAPAGGNFDGLNSIYDVNDSGQVVFDTDLSGGSNSEGIFRLDGQAGIAVVLRGTEAPGGGYYTNLHNPSINSSGQVAYSAQLESVGLDPSGAYLYTEGIGTIALATPGDPAPGGGVIDSAGVYDLNSSGHVLVGARLTGGLHSEGIFLHDGTAATAIALQNTAVPGMAATFFSDLDSSDRISISDAGIIVFEAKIIGAGITEANNLGYWYGTDASNLQLLVREGDTLFVNGANRTVASVYEMSSSEGGVVWNLWFTDNTTAITYTPFAELTADYNGDGTVNAADYTVWRDGGSPDDSTAGYNLWKANFGNSGSGSNVAVPEPAAWTLMFVAASCWAFIWASQRRRYRPAFIPSGYGQRHRVWAKYWWLLFAAPPRRSNCCHTHATTGNDPGSARARHPKCRSIVRW